MSQAYQLIGGIRVYKFIGKKFVGHPKYDQHHYCIGCRLEFPLEASRCNSCHRPLRTQPKAGVRLRNFKQKVGRP